MKKFKIIVLFLFCLLLYFVPAFLFKSDPSYYEMLHKPTYAPPALLFAIVWPILYIIFSLYIAIKLAYKSLSKEMLLYFLINYIISFFFNKVFFVDKKLFLTFTITLCSFISGLFLFLTTFKTSKKEFLIFTPYLLWTLFATILITHIYLLN